MRWLTGRERLALGLSFLLHALLLGAFGPTAGAGLGRGLQGAGFGTGAVPARLDVRFAPVAALAPGSATALPPLLLEASGQGASPEQAILVLEDEGRLGELSASRLARYDASLSFFPEELSYLPASALAVTPTPVSEPDIVLRPDMWVTGDPVRLRLFISATGEVRNIKVLRVNALDAAFVAELEAAFRRTRYFAGRTAAGDVASYVDIEMAFVAPGQEETVLRGSR